RAGATVVGSSWKLCHTSAPAMMIAHGPRRRALPSPSRRLTALISRSSSIVAPASAHHPHPLLVAIAAPSITGAAEVIVPPRPRSAPSWTPGPATRRSSKRGGALSNAGRTLRPHRSDLAEKRAPRLGELRPLPSVGGEDLIAAQGGLHLSHPSRMLACMFEVMAWAA